MSKEPNINIPARDLETLAELRILSNEVMKMQAYLVNTQSTITAIAVLLGVEPEKLAEQAIKEDDLRAFEKKVVTKFRSLRESKAVENSVDNTNKKE